MGSSTTVKVHRPKKKAKSPAGCCRCLDDTHGYTPPPQKKKYEMLTTHFPTCGGRTDVRIVPPNQDRWCELSSDKHAVHESPVSTAQLVDSPFHSGEGWQPLPIEPEFPFVCRIEKCREGRQPLPELNYKQ